MSEKAVRERNPEAKRRRIADAALDLFQRQGYAETTIDQIAAAAQVGRRTVFHHFPTKEAILFDHLVVRREVALRRLVRRPVSEPPLVSLHVVFRELCDEGYDRRLLAHIRTVLTTEPELAGEQLSLGGRVFMLRAVAALLERPDATWSSSEVHIVAAMACGWFTTAAHLYLVEGRPSLVSCFDDVVATAVRASAALAAGPG
ncbi:MULTISPECIES: TetR/AcrR family transcriptional regulator [unclassified Pseudofrankia]|uniref:TetR/AcrR family transcriptional regulator n=1 Tax=unclassified Pseudofrankia TaxID=2994372 RepID=UPI0008D9015A|nr:MULTISPECIES: TetR/AcrR family transcriptional regulator [unclassified Pseudofrankia]MDT3446397.1 TetR/AcrR family transcriptional regulator [Pseudofrankia sp. BMG5.37]OHV58010.1 TetR family transcriptional regulator [Pseudofrankia sp. BMG5.36]